MQGPFSEWELRGPFGNRALHDVSGKLGDLIRMPSGGEGAWFLAEESMPGNKGNFDFDFNFLVIFL